MKEPILIGLMMAASCAAGVVLSPSTPQFTPAQCSTGPTGEKNVERYVTKIDGAPMLMQREVGAEWITVCAKREWR